MEDGEEGKDLLCIDSVGDAVCGHCNISKHLSVLFRGSARGKGARYAASGSKVESLADRERGEVNIVLGHEGGFAPEVAVVLVRADASVIAVAFVVVDVDAMLFPSNGLEHGRAAAAGRA